jgi:hypothetical protein
MSTSAEADPRSPSRGESGPSAPLGDPLIYMDRAGAKFYHLFNHLGTALALASAAQVLTDTWSPQLAETRAGASCAIGLLSGAGGC